MSTGQEIAAQYELGEPIPFAPENFPPGTYALGGTGTVMRVEAWAKQTAVNKETDEAITVDAAAVSAWSPGWELKDIVPDATGVYPVAPASKSVKQAAFAQTDGKGWLLDPEALIRGEDEVPIETGQPEESEPEVEPEPEPVVEPPTSDPTKPDMEPHQDEEDALAPIITIPDIQPPPAEEEPEETTPPAEGEENPLPGETIETTEWKTGPHPSERSRAGRLYNYIAKRGQASTSELAEWVWDNKSTFRYSGDREGLKVFVAEIVVELRKDKWQLSVVNEGRADELIVAGTPDEAKAEPPAGPSATDALIVEMRNACLGLLGEGVVEASVRVKLANGVEHRVRERG